MPIKKVVSQEYGITTVETQPCIICKQTTIMELADSKYWEWTGGKKIQHVFPDPPVGQRELLITGTHDECWDKLTESSDNNV